MLTAYMTQLFYSWSSNIPHFHYMLQFTKCQWYELCMSEPRKKHFSSHMQTVLTELLSLNCRQRIFKYPQDPSFWSLNSSDYCEDWCINIAICFFESQKSNIHVCLFEIQAQTIYIRMQFSKRKQKRIHISLTAARL